MKHAIILLALALGGCAPYAPTIKTPVVFTIGTLVQVGGNEGFYKGCQGQVAIVDYVYVGDGLNLMEPKYTILDARCPGLKEGLQLRVLQSNLEKVVSKRVVR